MNYELTLESIDQISQEMTDWYSRCGLPKQEILRMRLSLEEALMTFHEQLGSGRKVTTHTGKRFGQYRFEVRVTGESVQPFVRNGEDEYLNLLLAQTGQLPAWSYQNGINHLSFSRTRKKKLSETAKILLGVVLGFGLGAAANYLLGNENAGMLSEKVLAPLSDCIMGFMSAMASIFVFTTMINSICGVGDVSTFSRIGKRMMGRFAIWDLIYIGIAVVLMMLLFPLTGAAGSGGGAGELYTMVLNIIPKDPVSPFAEGNALQIIFLSTLVGVVILTLGHKASALKDVFRESERVVASIINATVQLMPIVIFVSMFGLGASGGFSMILKMIRIPALLAVLCAMQILISLTRVCVTNHANPLTVLRKMGRTLLVLITTASSAAALPLGQEDCVKRFGISEKVSGIGLPLGQVLYRPSVAANCICLSFCLADYCGIPVSLQWVIQLALIALLISMALPPIPGAGVIGVVILFRQMGIPPEMLSIAIALDFVLDRLDTTTKFAVLELDLVQVAKSLNMLDTDVLRANGKK